MIELVNMVLVEVLFRCDKCGVFVTKQLLLKNNLEPDISQAPDGWVIGNYEGYFRAYCPEHAMLK